jgi:hypothetical protein
MKTPWLIAIYIISVMAGIFLVSWFASQALNISYWIALIGSCLLVSVLANIVWKIIISLEDRKNERK